jgi:hypothetical protein
MMRWSPSGRAGARATPQGGRRGGDAPLRAETGWCGAVEAWKAEGNERRVGAAEQFRIGESGIEISERESQDGPLRLPGLPVRWPARRRPERSGRPDPIIIE